MNYQFGEPNETQNSSNHLSIALHLIHLEKKEGPLPFSGLVISFLVFLLIILETLGNFLLLCMICYEKYGMDSKKRTVTNMLLSRIIFVLILFNIFIMPLPAIGQIFGVFSEYTLHGLLFDKLFNHPLISKFVDKFMFLAYEFGIYQTIRFIFLTAAEMFLFKALYIYNYSRIAGVNEYFLTKFVTSFNVITTFGFAVIRIGLEENLRMRLYYQNYAEPYEAYRKVHFP